MAVCEILSIGTEILLGDILDTNSRFFSIEMAKHGISVMYRSTVGDNEERLRQTFRTAIDRSDIVIASGGLGPTQDDITRDVICDEMGCEMRMDQYTADKISAYFRRKGMDMPESNLRQAMVPVDGVVFENKNGTAPGLGIKKNGKCVVILPGPPYECEPLFYDQVVPFLEEYFEGIIVSHEIRTMCIGESTMAEAVADLMESGNPTVAPYCKMGEALLRVTAKAGNEEEAEKMCAPVIEEICRRLGSVVYGIDNSSIEERVVEMLIENNMTVATAESCTAGYIAKRITDVPGASSVFKHGIVTYANEVKEKALGVKKETLDSFGAVSEETAKEMAQGVRNVTGADIGISVTGFAGPTADEEGKQPGLIYIALSSKDKLVCQKIETGKNNREFNRYVAASRALNLVRLALGENL